MLKILSASQARALDAWTIQNNPISSIDLMEEACRAFAHWFVARFDTSKKIGIICGTGNNGGDGMGIARILSDTGYSVVVWSIAEGKETEDFIINKKRLPDEVTLKPFGIEFKDTKHDVLIDAIFGSGLSRSAEGEFKDAIDLVNASEAVRVAVDIPSGLFADRHSGGAIVKADFTVSFQLPKLAFMMPENGAFAGEWHVVDIGLNQTFIDQTETLNFYVDKKSVSGLLKTRKVFSHKGDYGKALLIAGSHGKMGACVLGARACLRSGVGLLTVHVPECGYAILQTSVPEAMVSVDEHKQIFTNANDPGQFDVIGIGPGIGQADETVAGLKAVLNSRKALILDADALNMIAAHRELLHLIPKDSILTPHPKEFERLVGKWSDDFERLEKQRALSRELKSVVVLKGAYTSISGVAGEIFFNSTGNPGMATGGTGDVLTGIITGLRAQGYSALDASVMGVWLHGAAGDIVAKEKGMNSLIASDLIERLPSAFMSLEM